MPRTLLISIVAACLFAGCGDDGAGVADAGNVAAPDFGTGGTDGDDGDDGTGGSTSSSSGDGAGSDDAGTDDGSGGDTGGADGTDGSPTGGSGLPTDGEALSICFSSSDCNGDDLACNRYSGFTGYCSDDCAEDSDCPAIAGIEATCGSNNICRIDCIGMGEGDGDCPADMECVETSTGILSSGAYRCQYPEGSGAGTSGPYGPCDASHGDGDCQGDLACASMGGGFPLGTPSGPYCAELCDDASDCTPSGADGEAVCESSGGGLGGLPGAGPAYCQLICENDKDCPGDMLCFSSGFTSRCAYE